MVLLTALLSLVLHAGDPAELILGVAEEFWYTASAPEPQIRPAFRKQKEGWEVASAVDRDIRWTVCFNGKPHGVIDTKPLDADVYSRKGVQLPVDPQQVPFSGQRNVDFAGWLAKPVHHPLAVISTGQCGDPEGWRKKPLPKKTKQLLLEAMHELVEVEKCDNQGKWHPWKYPDSAVLVLGSIGSNRGEWLAMLQVRFPGWTEGCDGILDNEWQSQLFHVDGQRKVRRLGSAMRLVDTGDYDGDGHSEVLAKFEWYNKDGYTLFYNGLKQEVTLGWNYH